MVWAFFYDMKLALAKLKIVTFKVPIIVSVITYTTDYAIFGHEVKATERSPLDNLTRWISTASPA